MKGNCRLDFLRWGDWMMAILALPTSVDRNVIPMLVSIVGNIQMLIKSDVVLG